MLSIRIEPGLVTRGITYLYRWWLQAELGILPEAYIRRAGEAIIICPEWAIVGSAEPISFEEITRLGQDLKRPVFGFCPTLPKQASGWDLFDGTRWGLPPKVEEIIELLKRFENVLGGLGEENPHRDEWWRTRDSGEFKLWGTRSRRLLLYPATGAKYGFSITTGSDEGYFFYRSRSCKEEGRILKNGTYKMSEHALPSDRRVANLDLFFTDATVLLLQLRPVGAGFKVFPRRVPFGQGSLD